MVLCNEAIVIISVCTDYSSSISETQEYLLERGHNVSKRCISNYRKKLRLERGGNLNLCASKTRVGKRKLSPSQEQEVVAKLKTKDPPSYRDLATQYPVSKSTIFNIKEKHGLHTVKKPRVHAMSDLTIRKRIERCLPLAEKLESYGLERLVTSDEAWFYLRGTEGKREIQHLNPGETRRDAEVLPVKNHPQGVMVWTGICERGIIGPLFVESGAKINSKYYIDSILTPAINQTNQLYPDGRFLWHQDSAPAHASRMTASWLKNNDVDFISKEEWLPSSPDCAPCDFFLWGYVKWRVKKRQVSNLDELKDIIIQEMNNIPHKMITKAIFSMPQRLREVHEAHGKHLKKRV